MIKTITAIHGVPRSGTSWLAQLFNASPSVALKFQPLFSYAFKSYIDQTASPQKIQSFLEAIYHSDDAFINMKDANLMKGYPTFDKIEPCPDLVFKNVRYHSLVPHFLANNTQIKFVLIVRNPLSVLSSWKNAPREFDASWDFETEWEEAHLKNQNRAEEYFGFHKWKEATLLFHEMLQKYPQRVQIVKYSDLLKDTAATMQQLYAFAGIEFQQQVKDFIVASKSKTIDDPNSVFRQKINDKGYQKHISLTIQNKVVADLKGTELELYLD